MNLNQLARVSVGLVCLATCSNLETSRAYGETVGNDLIDRVNVDTASVSILFRARPWSVPC